MERNKHWKFSRDSVKSVADGKNGGEMRSCRTVTFDSPEFLSIFFFL